MHATALRHQASRLLNLPTRFTRLCIPVLLRLCCASVLGFWMDLANYLVHLAFESADLADKEGGIGLGKHENINAGVGGVL
jgi:hypothetical protein